MLIKEIQTGKTSGASRKAILVVNEKATQPGMLSELTEFLRAKGLAATPGYDEGHLLRVSNFDTDDTLRHLLVDEFPKWIKGRPNAMGTEKLIEEKIAFLPLDRKDRQPFEFHRFIRKYSTPLVGVLSIMSAGAMLYNATKEFLREKGPNNVCKNKKGIEIGAALFFMSASAALTGLGTLAARKPSVTELIQQLEPKLNQDPARFDPAKEKTSGSAFKSFVLNNPWKIATMLNLFGVITNTVSHAIPSYRMARINKIPTKIYGPDTGELIGSASSLVSLALIGTAAQEQPKSILGIKTFEKSSQASDPLEQRYRHLSSSLLSPLDPANDQGKAGHLNMKAAGFLSMASNALLAIPGITGILNGYRFKDPHAQIERSKGPLALLIPFNLAADYLTTLSKPRFSYSVDELATESADYIARKLDMKTATPETVTRQTFMLSELLANHPRVTGSARELREATAARLELDYRYKMPAQGTGLKEYQHLMEVSPFATAKPSNKIDIKDASHEMPARQPKLIESSNALS